MRMNAEIDVRHVLPTIRVPTLVLHRVAIAVNLVASGNFLDVAARDLVMATAAYTLARLTEARESTRAPVAMPIDVTEDRTRRGRVA